MTRAALAEVLGLGSGGALTKLLEELEESGFLLQTPRVGRAKRDSVYWLADEYSLFYLTWISSHRGTSDGTWVRKQGTPAWRAWSGLAFEALCLKHVQAIKRALGIEAVETVSSSWEHRPARRRGDDSEGAQIDLIIDRADRTMNLCEMKFSQGPFTIDKAYARELAHKRDVFREETGTSKSLFLTLVTSAGLKENEHSRGLITRTITLDALFSASGIP